MFKAAEPINVLAKKERRFMQESVEYILKIIHIAKTVPKKRSNNNFMYKIC